MSKETRTITNESGKQITMRIDPAHTLAHSHMDVVWTVSPAQWKRLVRESNHGAWSTERGAILRFTCHPYAANCKYPSRA